MRRCLLDDLAKFREVRSTIDAVSHSDAALRSRLEGLLQCGAFRHGVDVAYASILILRGKKSDDESYVDVCEDYVGIDCDPVYPQ